MYRLLVTGNGFDKACGMTTDFKDFIEYIKKIRRKNQQNISIDIGSIDSLLFNLCLTDNCLFDWLLNQAHFIDTWMCLEEILEETIFFFDD
ncbi:MAG: AbiH family protein, partial [Peptostreptococcaceae bacterium]